MSGGGGGGEWDGGDSSGAGGAKGGGSSGGKGDGGSTTSGGDGGDWGGGGGWGASPGPDAGGGDPLGGGGDIDPFGGGGGIDPFGGGGGSDGGPTIPNLPGPGPTGGFPGLPGAGGGDNPWGGLPPGAPGFPELPGLSGTEFDYLSGAPVGVGGVTTAGAGPATDGGVDPLVGLFGGDSFVGASGSGPGISGTSATAFAAPEGVSGGGDLTDPLAKATKGGGASAADAAKSPGLLESLGLTGKNMGGALAAGAGLLNNLINGNKPAENAEALKALAAKAGGIESMIAAKSAELKPTADATMKSGLEQIDKGKGMTDEGRALQQWVQTGTLPDAYEAQVQQGLQSAITRIRANHANRGMPTDPTRNSVLAEEIRKVQEQAPQMRMQLAQSLAQTGTGIVGAANQTIGTGAGLVNTGTNTSNSLIDSGIRAAGLSSDIYKVLLKDENDRNSRRGSAIANFAAALNSSPKKAGTSGVKSGGGLLAGGDLTMPGSGSGEDDYRAA